MNFAQKKCLAAGALLVLLTMLVYLPALRGGFIWDDDAHLTANPCVVGPKGLKDIWTSRAARICPLVQTTFWVEYRLWGLKPLPYHLVNILVQAACGVALWRVLLALKIPGAWLGAALWTLHPVQAESVAWITELKNTQSGLFYLLAIWWFAKSMTTQNSADTGKKYYALSLAAGLLAMASKSSTVVLPVVLGLVAWWLAGRWHWRNLRRLAPFFLMAAAASVVSTWTQRLEGGQDPEWARTWPERIVTAGKVVWFYLGKLVWPHPLIFIYPRWQIQASSLLAYVPTLCVISALLLFWWRRDGWGRAPFFALSVFVVALLPVLGLVDHYFLRFSFVGDHFQYLAGMSVLALVGSLVAASATWGRYWPATFGGLALLGLGLLTWRHVAIFHDDEVLWRDTVARNPTAAIARNDLGNIFSARGEWAGAEAQFQAVLKSNPNDRADRFNLANTLVAEGRVDDAIAQFNELLRRRPADAPALNNLGDAYMARGQTDRAEECFRRAVQAEPKNAQAWNNLGLTLARQGQHAEAVGCYESALRFQPGSGNAHVNLGLSLAALGRADESLDHFRRAVECQPDLADAHALYGGALANRGEFDQAIVQYEETLRLSPDHFQTHNNLAFALAQQGRVDEAIVHYEAAIRINPAYVKAHLNLGVLLGRLGRHDEAVEQVRIALRLKPDYTEAQEQLSRLTAAPAGSQP